MTRTAARPALRWYAPASPDEKQAAAPASRQSRPARHPPPASARVPAHVRVLPGTIAVAGSLVESPARTPFHAAAPRSAEHPSQLRSLMRISYWVFWLEQKQK